MITTAASLNYTFEEGIFQYSTFPDRLLVSVNDYTVLYVEKQNKYYYHTYINCYVRSDFKKIELNQNDTKLLTDITKLIMECMKIVEKSDNFIDYEHRARLLANLVNCPIDKISFDKDDFRAMINVGM